MKESPLNIQALPSPHQTVLETVWYLEGSQEEVERALHQMKNEEHRRFLGLDPDGD